MPMSPDFERRLLPILPEILQAFPTPLIILDELGMRQTGARLKAAFGRTETQNHYAMQQFFAVKAQPIPWVLRLMIAMGFGHDCSSIGDLILSSAAGGSPDRTMFTSNNTSVEEFEFAMRQGSLLNLDDLSFVSRVPIPFPRRICFRDNPGSAREGGTIIGRLDKCKYGVPSPTLIEAYRQARERGAQEFGIHAMLYSNQPDYSYFVQTVEMLLLRSEQLQAKLGIQIGFMNIGGGFGIPYKPGDPSFDLEALAAAAKRLLDEFRQAHGYAPALWMESGRFMTGPHGVLVVKCINVMHKWLDFVGVDGACTATIKRPAMYHAEGGGYHHISVVNGHGRPKKLYGGVVGPVCEDCDRFGWDRELPEVKEGDILLVYDTGAHCRPMADNYNNHCRPATVVVREDNNVELIQRAETYDDMFATYQFEFKKISPKAIVA